MQGMVEGGRGLDWRQVQGGDLGLAGGRRDMVPSSTVARDTETIRPPAPRPEGRNRNGNCKLTTLRGEPVVDAE